MTGVRARRERGNAVRATAAAMFLFGLAACASAPPARAPATTAQSQQAAIDPKNGDGVGGTGIKSDIKTAEIRRGDGIGGTGIRGTISGFGSIIVNGLELQFSSATSVADDGRPAALQDLHVGQVIEGVAREHNGKLTLDRLDIQHAVTGPITSIDLTHETLVVLGQRVTVHLAGDRAATEAFKTLQAGDVVSVSGLRLSDGTIVASRIDQQHDDAATMVRGDVAAVTATSLRVGDLDVPLAADTVVSAPKAGGRVLVSGRMINGQFTPQVINGSAGVPFGEDVTNVSLEGYLPANSAPLTIDGVAVSGAALPPGAAANDRVVVTGRVAGPDKITATGATKLRTVVTVLAAKGSRRTASNRPDNVGTDRVRPPDRPERPQVVRPEIISRPDIERPQA